MKKLVFISFVLISISLIAMYQTYRAIEQRDFYKSMYESTLIDLEVEKNMVKEESCIPQKNKDIEVKITKGLPLWKKNNNYLNIKASTDTYWKGQNGRDKFNHAIFDNPIYSIRAGLILLKTYEYKHKIDTIEKLIDRFCEGNKKEYIAYLEKHTGIKSNTKISLTEHRLVLLRAMIGFETGNKLGKEYFELLSAMK